MRLLGGQVEMLLRADSAGARRIVGKNAVRDFDKSTVLEIR